MQLKVFGCNTFLYESYFNKINSKECIKKAFYMLEVLLEVKIYQIISFIH